MGKHENGYARVSRDFYPTPEWVTWALIEHVTLAGRRIWEPACGDGRMSEVFKAAGASVYSSDIEDRGYDRLDAVSDFGEAIPPTHFDMIATNPAYGERNKTAVMFAGRGLVHIADGGLLALLLPSDFDSAKSRRHLFADCAAFAGKIILTRRIVWFPCLDEETGRQKAPKENHSWYLWRKPRASAPTILYAPSNKRAAA